MPLSEIDDIFSSKEKSKPVDPVASSSTLPEMKKKKKKKKPKRDSKGPSVLDDAKCEPPADDSDKKANSTEKKRPAPETVLDPSARIPSMKRAKMEKNNGSGNEPAKEKAGKREINQEKEDEDRFKDSRGSGPRRKTEDGFAIYKEDELGIGNEGGDTPLCPFDCQCCF